MKKKKVTSRRDILTLGLVAGAGIITVSKIQQITAPNGDSEKVKLMSANGQLVEVERRHLPKEIRKKPVSNKELREWIQNK